jgi:poly-gamma-glutamate capsule biosynthesis protein CapA/YwtB (metallophosphatase superfamily)
MLKFLNTKFLVILFFICSILLSFPYFISQDFRYFKKLNIKNSFENKLEENLVLEKIEKNNLENQAVSLLFVGDIMLSRGVEYLYPKYKNTSNYPFQNMKDFLNNFDLTVGNLETPITSHGPYMTPYSLVFNSNPKYIKILKNAGFDILSLANNHAMDKGEKGLLETVKFLEKENINTIGVGEKCREGIIKEIKGIKIGFLAYSYTAINDGRNISHKFICDFNDQDKIKEDILNLKNKVDFVVIFSHSGEEYKHRPSEKEEDKLKSFIDFGADVVINSHPHVVQKVENYKNGLIAYSLGNFVFDNQENKDTEIGLALEVLLEFSPSTNVSNKKISYLKHNIQIKNYCCPEVIK